MLKGQKVWTYFQQHRLARNVIAYLVIGCMLIGSFITSSLAGTFASGVCANNDQAYTVKYGDTLGNIANRYNTTWQALAAHNKLANPNMIDVNQTICIPGKGQGQGQPTTSGMSNVSHQGQVGTANLFPFGQCTFWANQRYHDVHGIFVPWTFNSDAWQWTARATEYHWNVSSTPSVGSIVDLQPWVDGAYNLGHVAYVEQVLPNGHVLASTANWAGSGGNVVTVDYAPGPGVTFISY